MSKATACAALATLATLAVAGCSASPSASAPAPGSTSAGAGLASPVAGSAATSGVPGAAGSAPAPSVAAASAAGGPGQASAGSATAAASAKPKIVDGNIAIAPAGRLMPGPITITPLYCGKLSAAQQQQFGTSAAGGLIYRYANNSDTVSSGPKLYVGFTDGAAEAGANYGGHLPDIAAGQSAEGEVDAIGIKGQDLSFTGCEVMSYALDTAAGTDPVSYAG